MTKPPSRQNILAMTELLRKFKPLVNEKNLITGFEYIVGDGRPPERDEMLMVMTGAVYDIQSFIQNWDQGMKKQAELISDAMMAHQAMANVGIDVKSLAEGFEKVTARHRQALDVLDFIAGLAERPGAAPARLEVAIEAASKFINPVKQRIAEMENENSNPSGLNSHPTESFKVIPAKDSNADSDAKEGEPRS